MKEGQMIDRVFIEQKGKMAEIVIRALKKDDVTLLWRFYNKVMKETDFLSRITPLSLKAEKKWVEETLRAMKKGDKIQLVAETDEKIIGGTGIEKEHTETQRHTGLYGISILQKYTGIGLGTKLTEHVLRIAKNEMKLEMVVLKVFAGNKIAQNLYRKTGFKYAGKIPKARKRNGKYQDEITMYKVLK